MSLSINSDLKKIILLVIAWRLILFLIAYLSPFIIPTFGARFPYFEERLISTNLPHFIWSFGNFDGVHYLGIAKDGYAYQFTQAFFPLYPILIKITSYLTLGNYLISALLISNISFLISAILFYKLVKKTFGKSKALWSVIFLLTFPTSFYFGSVYTEGLFFLMIIASFYLLEKNKIWLSSIIGSTASATRLVGVFLAPTIIIKKDFKSLVPLIIAPLGLFAYIIYLKLEFNNALYFLTSQSIFGQERSTTTIVLLPQVFFRYLKILTTTSGLVFFNALFELTATILALTLLIIGIKTIKKQWLLFSFLSILTPTLTGTLASMPRYILVAFPIYIVLASIKNTLLKIVIALIFTIFLFIFTVLFSQGYWVA